MISLDLETNSLNWRTGKIVGASIYGDGYKEFYLWEEFKKEFPNGIPEMMQPVIFHNAKFDLHFLSAAEYPLPKQYHDTKLMAYLINPGQKTGLKRLGATLLNLQVIEFHDVCGKGKKAITFDKALEQHKELATKYAIQDAELTYKLYPILKKQMSTSLWKVYEKLELPFIKVLLAMEQRGICIDIPYLHKLKAEFAQRKQHTLDILEDHAKINWNSPKQIAKLFQEWQIPLQKKSLKTGRSSVDVETLKQLAPKSNAAKFLLQYRNYHKQLRTYIEPILKETYHGKLYPQFNQMVARTSRLSSSSPINIQNIPKNDRGKGIRGAFTAKPNMVFTEGDYSAQEVRLLAHYSRDKRLVQFFVRPQNLDIYEYIVQQTLQCETKKAKEKRPLGKLLFLAMSYGAQAKKLVKSAYINEGLQIPEYEMQALFNGCKSAFPQLFKWREEVIRKARKDGYAKTLCGNVRYLPKINSPDKWERWAAEREAVNTIIQGSGANIIKLALTKLHNLGYNILLTVHDSVLIEANKGVDVSKIQEIMEGVVKLSVHMKVDIKIKDRWGE